MAPNIVLIEVDQMRGDCLGALGHPVVETPYLDMMARDGVLFRHAYSAVPSCIAARAAILTGMSQENHGRVGYADRVPWDYPNFIAQSFAEAGYHTQAIGKMHVYPTRSLCGFHNVILHDGYMGYNRRTDTPMHDSWNETDDYLKWLRERLGSDVDIIDSGLECNSWVARPWHLSEQFHPTNWVVNESIDFLRRRDPTRPFFLKMSFVRPHSPLDPPQAYFDQYIHQDIPLPPVGDWAEYEDHNEDGRYIDAVKGVISPRALKRQRAAYYGLITHIDHQIGRFLQSLIEYGLRENTVILFVSDHGDMLGDHNWFRKSVPYQGSVNVPFLIYDPGRLLKCKHNQLNDDVVELRDIMPTLLDIAGIEIPDTVDGLSLKRRLEEGTPWRDYIHGEHTYGQWSNHYITNGSEKYIWFSQTGREQYFRLDQDPAELRDLAQLPEHRERLAYWRHVMVEALAHREEGYSDGRNLIVGRKPVATLKAPRHRS